MADRFGVLVMVLVIVLSESFCGITDAKLFKTQRAFKTAKTVHNPKLQPQHNLLSEEGLPGYHVSDDYGNTIYDVNAPYVDEGGESSMYDEEEVIEVDADEFDILQNQQPHFVAPADNHPLDFDTTKQQQNKVQQQRLQLLQQRLEQNQQREKLILQQKLQKQQQQQREDEALLQRQLQQQRQHHLRRRQQNIDRQQQLSQQQQQIQRYRQQEHLRKQQQQQEHQQQQLHLQKQRDLELQQRYQQQQQQQQQRQRQCDYQRQQLQPNSGLQSKDQLSRNFLRNHVWPSPFWFQSHPHYYSPLDRMFSSHFPPYHWY